jgi:hypothetical protein
VGLKSTRRDKCSVRGGFLALHDLQGQLIGDLGGEWNYMRGDDWVGLALGGQGEFIRSRPVGTFIFVSSLIFD